MVVAACDSVRNIYIKPKNIIHHETSRFYGSCNAATGLLLHLRAGSRPNSDNNGEEQVAKINKASFCANFDREQKTYLSAEDLNVFGIEAVVATQHRPFTDVVLCKARTAGKDGTQTTGTVWMTLLPEWCFGEDKVGVSSFDVGWLWEWGEVYWLEFYGNGYVGRSDSLNTNSYIGRDILDYLYNPTGLDERVASDDMQVGHLSVTVGGKQASLCDLRGVSVSGRCAGGATTFRVLRAASKI